MARTPTAEHRYAPDLVLPPGETLVEVIAERGMTQAELAARTGLSAKHINQIVKGIAPITPDTALLLESTTGVSARVWSNLEIAYREHESRVEQAARLQADLGWLDELPINELIKKGWLPKGASPLDRLVGVCRFFGVANRSAWDAVWHKPTAYRTSKAFSSHPGAVAAWLRIGEIEAAAIDCAPFDRTGLNDLLPVLRALTVDPDPGRWWPQLVGQCAEVGVAVIAEPEIKGARINGAARWLTHDKALVQLSLRHRWSDIFWFTLFHELGHLLLHSKKDMFINDVGAHSGVEQEADAFASQLLIPRSAEAALGELTTTADVVAFANTLGIAPGIVVGRLQHESRWPFSRGNDLKQRFVFTE
ncbi:MAG TPA: helix-turn-helix domain-containing protein [Baekduia sp.]|nr:helix-turn-helix domain-containing protein [Baekduia sp.]HPE12421.1 helix-turn-helix domain-containing protein [Actinomycetota bacterium]